MFHSSDQIKVFLTNFGIDIVGMLGALSASISYLMGYPMTSWAAGAGIVTSVGFALYRIYDREAMRSVEKSLKREEARQLKITNDEREFALSEKKNKANSGK